MFIKCVIILSIGRISAGLRWPPLWVWCILKVCGCLFSHENGRIEAIYISIAMPSNSEWLNWYRLSLHIKKLHQRVNRSYSVAQMCHSIERTYNFLNLKLTVFQFDSWLRSINVAVHDISRKIFVSFNKKCFHRNDSISVSFIAFSYPGMFNWKILNGWCLEKKVYDFRGKCQANNGNQDKHPILSSHLAQL